jgi:hypothetical protein
MIINLRQSVRSGTSALHHSSENFQTEGEMYLRMLNRMPARSIWSRILGMVFAITVASKSGYSEFDDPSLAVNYCRNYSYTIKLSENRTILCFDGPITADRDTSAFNELKQNGLFVIRSYGGFAAVAMILSNILLEKNATVIVYDYCLSACANYFLIASFKTYVTKNTIVAWHGGGTKVYCGPGDIERMRKSYRDAPNTDGYLPPELACKTGELSDVFFKQRGIDNRHIYKPQTIYTKKLFDVALREAPNKSKIFWMWNPRNYGDYFRSKITYESYPNSQEEVDEIVRRLRLGVRVFYDPPQF